MVLSKFINIFLENKEAVHLTKYFMSQKKQSQTRQNHLKRVS